MEWLYIFLIGSIIGSILGLIGVGGGIVFTPMAVHFLHYPREEAMGLALLVICAASISAALPSWKKKEISWPHVALYGTVAPIASFFSAYYAYLIPTSIRLWSFIFLLFLAGLSMLFSPDAFLKKYSHTKKYYFLQVPIAGVIGIIAGLLGLGAGFLFVPALYYWGKLHISKAIASSLTIVSLSSAGGFLGAYSFLEASQTRWSPVLSIAFVALFFSLVLSRWRQKTAKIKLQFLFCGILWIIAIGELLQAIS